MPRFDDFTTITARFDSRSTACGHREQPAGHDIHAGDRIGYCRRAGKSHTICAACWQVWQAENAEADRLERSY